MLVDIVDLEFNIGISFGTADLQIDNSFEHESGFTHIIVSGDHP